METTGGSKPEGRIEIKAKNNNRKAEIIEKSKYFCSQCKQPQDHSFSSECCGAYAINEKGEMILNVKI